MVVVQAEGCAPIVKAFREGATSAPMFPNAQTIAAGLRVPAAVGDFIMIDILHKSHGTAITVSDAELMQGVSELAQHQGMHCAPEGGAVWRAARQLKDSGWIRPDETVMLFNTGAAVKYNHLLRCEHALTLDHTDTNVIDRLESIA
jgi:threonine synthase